MVVVAEAGVSTEFGFQAAENLGNRLDVLAFMRDVVARKYKQIWLKPVRNLHRSANMVKRSERAVMNVREVNDAKPVELFRQPREPNLDPLERKAVRFVDGIFRHPREIAGKFTQRPLGGDQFIDPLGELLSFCPCRFDHVSV